MIHISMLLFEKNLFNVKSIRNEIFLGQIHLHRLGFNDLSITTYPDVIQEDGHELKFLLYSVVLIYGNLRNELKLNC